MDTAIPPREETGSQISARLLEVIAHANFEVDQTGLAERIRRRLAASRSS